MKNTYTINDAISTFLLLDIGTNDDTSTKSKVTASDTSKCHCKSINNAQPYCEQYEYGGDDGRWCYIGGAEAASCPGAIQSSDEIHYWTRDPLVCQAAEPSGKC